MPRRSKLQTTVIGFLIVVGLAPIIYFATVHIEGAAAASESVIAEVDPSAPLDRPVDNVAFGVGERLEFDIGYGFINAGSASMEVRRLIEYNGRPAYQILTRAQSNSFFSTFFKVDDRVESIMDAIGLFSWRFEKNLREGSYESDRMYTFDQRNQLVYYEGDTIETPPFVQDPLSVLYYVRTQPLEVGKSVFIDNFTDGELYPLEVRVVERERISVEAGTFDCLVVEPLLQAAGVFKHEGKLRVWLTDDRLKMPVLMKSKVLVGSITAELTDYKLGELDAF
jgi:hypothetical protein